MDKRRIKDLLSVPFPPEPLPRTNLALGTDLVNAAPFHEMAMMDPPDKDPRPVEVSVVIPCLNEADTLKRVIQKAFQVMEEQGIIGEIVVADNGSSDGSPDIAVTYIS